MDALTAKLRTRDRYGRQLDLSTLLYHVETARHDLRDRLYVRDSTLASLVFTAQALHARRGTLNLPSTQRAIARYVF